MATSEKLLNNLSRGHLISVKAVFIFFLVILMIIPLLLVYNTILSRQHMHTRAVNEISQAWGKSQQLAGPVLVIPYNSEGSLKTIAWLPELMQIEAKIEPEIRSRGMFEAVVYKSKVQVLANFILPDEEKLRKLIGKKSEILWPNANISMGISDLHHLKINGTATINNREINLGPGSGMPQLLSSGLHASFLDLRSMPKGTEIPFAVSFDLHGSDAITFLPFGRSTLVSLNSSWPHPSFMGAFLPQKREITKNGFAADFELSYFSRSYAQVFTSDQLNEALKSAIDDSNFGVRLIKPVDPYRQSERAAKYGILFVIFTFIIYFLFELVSKARIHIFQYALVGVALCTFFLLLVSFAEHIGFAYAYILGAALVIAQVTLYSFAVTKSLKQSIIMMLTLGTLYLYLYLVLQLEDYALLSGSLALFVALALIMIAVRNVDWFSEANFKGEPNLKP